MSTPKPTQSYLEIGYDFQQVLKSLQYKPRVISKTIVKEGPGKKFRIKDKHGSGDTPATVASILFYRSSFSSTSFIVLYLLFTLTNE